MAQFDRVIPPGGEGRILLKVNTKGYAGKVAWQARIFSNDGATPVHTIRVEGIINAPVVFWPDLVLLKGSPGEAVTQIVRIEGKLDRPLKIEALDFNLTEQVSYQIVEVVPEKAYEVRITSLPNLGKRYRGYLKLKTGYEEKPSISIQIWGDFSR